MNISQAQYFLTEPASWTQKVRLHCHWHDTFWCFNSKYHILKMKNIILSVFKCDNKLKKVI